MPLPRARIVTLLVLAFLAGAGATMMLGRSGGDDPASASSPPEPAQIAPVEPLPAAPAAGTPEETPVAGDPPSDPNSGADLARSPEPSGVDPSESSQDALAMAWAQVDLDAVRAALPDNLYWTTSVPTSDPAVIEARAQEKARWNEAWGKVLSNTATHEEIHTYYAHRQRVSEDAIAFANYLLNHYSAVIPERDQGLLELSVRLHLARLEEIPRQITDALERAEAHAATRAAWLEQQAAFAAGDAAEAPAGAGGAAAPDTRR